MFRVTNEQLYAYCTLNAVDYVTYDQFVDDQVDKPDLSEAVFNQLRKCDITHITLPESVTCDLVPSLVYDTIRLVNDGYEVKAYNDGRDMALVVGYRKDQLEIVQQMRDEVMSELLSNYDSSAIGRDHDESCPGCGCNPGDGVSEDCEHPDGCGYTKQLDQSAADRGPYGYNT